MEIKSAAGLFPEPAFRDHFFKRAVGRRRIGQPLFKIAGHMGGDVEPDLVSQPQRSHRHAEIQHHAVHPLDRTAFAKQPHRLDHVGHQNPIHEEARAVLHDHREFSDGLHKLKCRRQRIR